jgi:hypothetical protein
MPEALFTKAADGSWLPDPFTRGPFEGMQGGAAAALMCAEIERAAAQEAWGLVAAFTAHFLRPVPLERLSVAIEPLRRGKRVNIIDAQLSSPKGVCAIARATLIGEAFVDATPTPPPDAGDPSILPLRTRAAHHGGPWLMDAMEVRGLERGMSWFRLKRPVAGDSGRMTAVLPAADWAHGIWPPMGADRSGLAMIPNPEVSVHLFRAPVGEWIGVDAASAWSKQGIGAGWAALRDVEGLIGRVAMSVAVSMIGA